MANFQLTLANLPADELIKTIGKHAKELPPDETPAQQKERYASYALAYIFAAVRAVRCLYFREAFDLWRRARLWADEPVLCDPNPSLKL